jgi:LysR family glycine cleavage system transcriptional activator
MNWRSMPPLASLRAFGAFVQTGSVGKAGDLLNISHAAISQHLRGLERHLGVALFDRSARSLILTEAGNQLARAVELGFGAIDTVIRDLTQADSARPVHVSTTPSFAAAWLVPRLPAFRAANPQVNLMLDPSPELVTLAPGGVDIALRYGDGNWSGLHSEPLLLSPIVVVAAPALLSGRSIDRPADLADLPWLEELGTTEATRWLQAQGVAQGIVGSFVQMPGNLLLDAARDGQGAAVTVRHFVEPDLHAGRLVELFTGPGDKGYHIVTRPGMPRPAAYSLVKWLRRQRATG